MRKFRFEDYDSEAIDRALDRICQDLARSAQAAQSTHAKLKHHESMQLLSDLMDLKGEEGDELDSELPPPDGTKFN